MTGQLHGKVALVTGGSAGIGLATAKLMAAEGATVYLTGRRAHKVDDAVAALDGTATGLTADVADLTALDRVFTTIENRSGRLDVVVANAGSGDQQALGAVAETDFDAVFATNVKGTFFTVQGSLPLLTHGASVIIMASISGIKAAPGMSVYGATKAAVRHLARSWAVELASRGIRVTALCPGPIDTPGMDRHRTIAAQADPTSPLPTTPLGRLGTVEEVAAAALFLAIPQSALVTGSDLLVDGGAAL